VPGPGRVGSAPGHEHGRTEEIVRTMPSMGGPTRCPAGYVGGSPATTRPAGAFSDTNGHWSRGTGVPNVRGAPWWWPRRQAGAVVRCAGPRHRLLVWPVQSAVAWALIRWGGVEASLGAGAQFVGGVPAASPCLTSVKERRPPSPRSRSEPNSGRRRTRQRQAQVIDQPAVPRAIQVGGSGRTCRVLRVADGGAPLSMAVIGH
jgi:hypothetical protein